MNYYQVNFNLGNKVKKYVTDLFKYELLQVGFDAFVDISDNEFQAYCPENEFSKEKFICFIDNLSFVDKSSLQYNIIFIKDENWNTLWESSSPSVKIGDFCHIRKSNQPYIQVTYDIIINPQQSFGTANHPTTYMIIEYLSTINMHNKNIMDMGCGTAVLGILCKKMGASYVECIDIDSWAYNNAIDNIKANNVDVTVKLGSTNQISKNKLFDIFLANINLNILKENIKYYVQYIKTNGFLILSGFYENDITELLNTTKQHNLTFYYKHIKDDWALLILKKY